MADGPLTNLLNEKGRTDANGYLEVNQSTSKTGPDGPLTPSSMLRVRVDANGYLLVVKGN
jgi:hypothetical protein